MGIKRRVLEWIWKHSATLYDIASEDFAEDCPNYDSCSEGFMENYEPSVNEGYW